MYTRYQYPIIFKMNKDEAVFYAIQTSNYDFRKSYLRLLKLEIVIPASNGCKATKNNKSSDAW